jgi:hypothetical protein
VSVSRLIRAFSTRRRTPVQTEEVLEVLKTWGVRDEIWFFTVQMDTEVMKGQLVQWETPWNDNTTKRYADIYTAAGLSPGEKRLIECKELLHLLDPDWALVNTREAILGLIEKIVVPPEMQDPFGDDMEHANSDRLAIIHALAVLFPWEVREALLPVFAAGRITVKQIAEQVVDLPEKYVATVMSKAWQEIYGILAGVIPTGYDYRRTFYRVVRHTYKNGQLAERAVLSGHEAEDTAISRVGEITKQGDWRFEPEPERWSTADGDGCTHHILIESF